MPKITKAIARKTALLGAGAVLTLGLAASPAFKPASLAPSAAQAAVSPAPPGGMAGFVVSSIDWATGPDGDKSNCPNGMTELAGVYNGGGGEVARPAPGQRVAALPGAGAGAPVAGQIGNGGPPGGFGPGSPFYRSMKACEFPQDTGPDPLHRTVAGSQSKVYGLNLDDRDSGQTGAASCSHDNFQGANGEAGVDNQFWRAVGCSSGWQASGGKRLFGQEMLTGAWGILISLRGVDSLVNDRDVRVGIYANGDPIQLSAARNPLSYASYNPDQDPRFRGETKGRIVNGVLTTDPVDIRFHSITNSIRLERPIDGARLRMQVMPDGSLEGVLAGYAKVDDLYNFVVGYRNGKDEKGNLSRLRFGSAGGSAASAGITCNGLYHAMKQLADGERDGKTGQCGAISHAYRIKAVPAFVVEKPVPVTTAVRKR